MPRKFQTTRRVEFRDTDAAGIAHFSVFFTYMEEAEHELWRQLGLSVKQTDADGVVSWPRANAHCDYKSAVRFEDQITIDVSVERIGEKSVTFAFDIRCGGREVAVGRMTAVCCRFPPTGPPQSIPIPETVRAKLEAFQAG